MHDLEHDVRPIVRHGGEPFGAIMGADIEFEIVHGSFLAMG